MGLIGKFKIKKFEIVNDIPEFPRCDSEEERLEYIQAYLEAGAIPKEELISGDWYIGQSRSTNIAQWFPIGGFHFPRYKMDGKYVDNIPHFTENVDTDVFIPFKKIKIW